MSEHCATAILLVAAEAHALNALEKVGRRGGHQTARGKVHPACRYMELPDALAPRLFKDLWTNITPTARALGIDHEVLQQCLDNYVRDAVTNKKMHDRNRLLTYLTPVAKALTWQ